MLLFFGLIFNNEKTPHYIPIINKITNRYIDEIPKKYELKILGTGGGMMHDVKEVCIHFESHQKCTLQQVRRIYVEMAERYFNLVNNNKEIQPYLHHRPFGIESINFFISYFNQDGSRPDKKYVAFVTNDKGILIYHQVRSDDRFMCRIFHEEPYVEALRIIQEEDRQILNK